MAKPSVGAPDQSECVRRDLAMSCWRNKTVVTVDCSGSVDYLEGNFEWNCVNH